MVVESLKSIILSAGLILVVHRAGVDFHADFAEIAPYLTGSIGKF